MGTQLGLQTFQGRPSRRGVDPGKTQQPGVDRRKITLHVEPVELVLPRARPRARRARSSAALSPRAGGARGCDRSARRRTATLCACPSAPAAARAPRLPIAGRDDSERTSFAVRSTYSSRTKQRNATCNRPEINSGGTDSRRRDARESFAVHFVRIDEGHPRARGVFGVQS